MRHPRIAPEAAHDNHVGHGLIGQDVSRLQDRVFPLTIGLVTLAGALLQVRAGRWSAGETRYFASGRIEVVAEVSLLDFLKPVSLERGVERPEALREPAITGILIDARGTDVLPAWFPEIRAPNGEVLWDGSLWADAAVSQIPVVWVGDPAHMAVARVGEDPLIVHAGSGGPGVVVLDPLDAVRFRTTLTGSAMLRQANMVVVVDP